MNTWGPTRLARRCAIALLTLLPLAAAQAQAQAPAKPYEPRLGQSGKDVMWLPSKENMVERLFQMGEVTRRDFVVDLGSGDGKIPIAAARLLGAHALGVEFNPNLVDFSRRRAAELGVDKLVEFRQADIFATDYSKATVVTLYLLPELNVRLRPQLLKMKPGTRILSNSWDMQTWQPDETTEVGTTNGYLWIIPAHVAGNWRISYPARGTSLPQALELRQRFQKIDGNADFGSFKAVLADARLRGSAISFAYRDARGDVIRFSGTADGDRITGSAQGAKLGKVRFTADRTVAPQPFEEGPPTQQETSDAIRSLGNQ